ncbi:MAG: serine/threonine protein kinase [Chroococcus sp. CMT-3BRIN-NPC107]|jgi:WD40 repeat protein/tRNA A-37 threonylcarbamoyl transferase component Bud32|nr:serine/threonine protein kinase [Chroococcus sp. CMT-3BRIN-NPC107]
MSEKLLKQRYQIIKVLKSGEFCQIYLAKDIAQQNGSSCIIKQILLPTSDRVDNLQQHFYKSLTREVTALKILNTCDRVPRLLAGFKENLEFYLVQEFIEGYCLDVEIYPGCCWDESRVIALVYEVLEILAVVHSYGLIHRNLKPSNLIRQNSTHKLILIDFGAAKQAWTQVATTPTSFSFGVGATISLGTPGYMPAEQERGTPRFSSDIYALGIMAIQALTGLNSNQLLKDSETGEILWQQHASISHQFADILSKMVSYHFQDRYQSATDTLHDLQPLIDLPAPPEIVKSTQAVASNTRKKFKLSLSVVSSAIATILTLIAGCYYLLQSPSPILKAENPLVAAKNTTNLDVTLAHTLKSHKDVVWCAVSSFDGQTLISSSGDKTIKVWNLLTGKLRATLTSNFEPVLAVAISKSNHTIASGNYSIDRAINLWNLSTGIRRNLGGNSNHVWSVAISPNEELLASSNGDGSMDVWNLSDRQLRYRLVGHLDTVWSVAISPNSQMLASASSDKTINLWDLRSRELLHTFTGHSDRVRTVAFSPNGRIIASGSWDKSIKIWDLQTKTLLRSLSGHSDYVNSVAISPNGQILASGSDDGTVKLWNLASGELLQTLKQHSGNVNSVSFNPDGNILISASGDKTIKIWWLNS